MDGKKADRFTLPPAAGRRDTFDAPRRVYVAIVATRDGTPAPVVLRLE